MVLVRRLRVSSMDVTTKNRVILLTRRGTADLKENYRTTFLLNLTSFICRTIHFNIQVRGLFFVMFKNVNKVQYYLIVVYKQPMTKNVDAFITTIVQLAK